MCNTTQNKHLSKACEQNITIYTKHEKKKSHIIDKLWQI